MTDMDDVTQLPSDFDGRVRLFPLPDLVVFPHAMQPLHIFEPRYCELLTDALESDGLIAMATTDPLDMSDKRPALERYVCIGRIISHVVTDDQKHNVLLLGARRAELRTEMELGHPFRIADVEVISDFYPSANAFGRKQLRDSLLDAFWQMIPETSDVQRNLHELMTGQMPIGPITDIIAHTLPFCKATKISLLGEGNVDRRAEKLTDALRQLATKEASTSDSSPGETFPPPFSLN